MVDQWTGEWTEEKDYSTYPKEKWCDYDYMTAWIREQKYEPETSMKNLIEMIFGYYFENDDVKERGYFAIKDERKYPDNLMIFVLDVAEYVFASGGLSEFDYEAQIGVMEMKNNDYPIYFKNKGNDVYASYDGIRWFWYGNMEYC